MAATVASLAGIAYPMMVQGERPQARFRICTIPAALHLWGRSWEDDGHVLGVGPHAIAIPRVEPRVIPPADGPLLLVTQVGRPIPILSRPRLSEGCFPGPRYSKDRILSRRVSLF